MSSNKKVEDKNDPSEACTTSITLIEKRLFYKKTGNVFKGKISDVVTFANGSGQYKALKIITGAQVRKSLTDIWFSLDHENIIKLDKKILIPHVPSTCFVMDRCYTNLEIMVNHPVFRENPDKMDDLKRWMSDLLSGVDYIHSMKLCHLNIQASNILITYNSKAKVAGFSYITSSTEPVSG